MERLKCGLVGEKLKTSCSREVDKEATQRTLTSVGPGFTRRAREAAMSWSGSGEWSGTLVYQRRPKPSRDFGVRPLLVRVSVMVSLCAAVTRTHFTNRDLTPQPPPPRPAHPATSRAEGSRALSLLMSFSQEVEGYAGYCQLPGTISPLVSSDKLVKLLQWPNYKGCKSEACWRDVSSRVD